MPRRKERPLEDIKTCQDVIQCIFGLGDLDITIYRLLVEHGEMRADRMARLIRKDRSTAYRGLQRLTACGLCVKEKRYREEGGYYHIYRAVPPEAMKNQARECVERWYRGALKELERIYI